ncbi:MAG TPA: hypothetical protein VMP00_11815 [Burkholderiales bacterium]|nr:hypothetical protein [Burkholderiales bacterium]
MNALKHLMVAVMAVGVLGSVQAETAGEVPHPDTSAPTQSTSRFVSVLSTPDSFVDIADLPPGMEHRLLAGDTIVAAGEPAATGLTDFGEPASAWPEGANAGGSMLSALSTPQGDIRDLTASVVQETPALSGPGAGSRGAGALFPTKEIPEPAGWAILLCGLAVMLFMARRRGGRFAD